MQYINTGSSPNAGDGDSLRSAFFKINNNFNELYNLYSLETGPQGVSGPQGPAGDTIIGPQGPEGPSGIATTSSLVNGVFVTTLNSVGDITTSGDILPGASNQFNLGSDLSRWNTVYVNTLTIRQAIVTGDYDTDNYTRLRHVENIPYNSTAGAYILYGFTSAFEQATVLVNEDENVNQVIFLGDSGSNSNETLFGIGVADNYYLSYQLPTTGFESTWQKKLELTGKGNLYLNSGTLYVSSSSVYFNNTRLSVSTTTGISINGNPILQSISNHILPSVDLTYDLGSTSTQWRSLYIGTSTIYLGGTALSVTGGKLSLDGQDANPFDQVLNTNNDVQFNTIALTGRLDFSDGTTSTGASVYVSYATSSSYKITTEVDMLGSYLPQTFEVIGDRIKLPNGNGLIQSGDLVDAWSLDSLNKSFTFPNQSDIEYGDGTYLSTGSLRVRVDMGGDFGIFLGEPNKTWTFDNNGNLTLPGKVIGYDPGEFGYESVVLQPSSAVEDRFLFYIDQTAGTFNRAGMELPTAYNNKAVTLAFPHDNSSVGYIFNQGTDTIVGTELNNALNIMMNSGDVKITALSAGPTYTSWTFKQNGNLELPNGAEIRDVNGDLRLRSAPGEVTQLQGIDSSGFVDSAVKVFYSSGSYVTINTNIDAGSPEHVWTFDYNGNLTFPDGSEQTTAYTESITTFEIDATTTSTTGLLGANTIVITPAIGYSGSDPQSLGFTGRDVAGRRTLVINASTLCTIDIDFGNMMGPLTVAPSTIVEVIYTGNDWFTISSNSI